MSVEVLKDRARRHEQREDWQSALDLYRQAINTQSEEEQLDIGLWNRVGDLLTRLGNLGAAFEAYEKAVDLYVESELANSAIAVCKKIVRHMPLRNEVYLRMGKIRVEQGFLVDARQSFLTYAERMQAQGDLDEAFRALIEFADLAPQDADIRLAIAGQLRQHERPEEALLQLRAGYLSLISQGREVEAEVFGAQILELDPSADLSNLDATVAEEDEGGGTDSAEDVAGTEVEADSEAEQDLVGAFEATALHEDTRSDDAEEPREQVHAAVAEGGSDDDRVEGFEPTALPGFSVAPGGSAAKGDVAEVESDKEVEEVEEAQEVMVASADDDEDLVVATASPDEDESFAGEKSEFVGEAEGEPLDPETDLPAIMPGEVEEEDEDVEPLPLLSAVPAAHEEMAVEQEGVGELLTALHEAVEEAPPREEEAEDSALAGAEEADIDSAVGPDLEPAVESAEETEVAPADFSDAIARTRALIEAEPDEVSHHQRLVDLAVHGQDDDMLISAYLGLGRSLEGAGESSRARAIYEQILTIDAGHAVATEALRAGTPTAPRPMADPPKEDYIDLGSLVLEDEEEEEKSTRFVVPFEEPSGDEAADFAKMLQQFKQKVSENVALDDVRAHQDLGTAYKEMGLLDEAIEEYQVALRGSPSHLPTYELLGQCFIEKGEHEAALRSLTRALDAPYSVEDDLLGILYYLARAHEALGDTSSAIEFYDRVFALDINFADVTERLRALR